MVQDRIDLKNLFVEAEGQHQPGIQGAGCIHGEHQRLEKRKERAKRGLTGKAGGLFRLFRGLSAGPDREPGYDINGRIAS